MAKRSGGVFWIDQYTFSLPLKHSFENQKIKLPQHNLIKFFLRINEGVTFLYKQPLLSKI
ncbi:hypothetical protein CQA62_04085 [Helicobacter cholecystus]|uniref:Uncharacterized protein n=1 Tax=Helicobacter cholecystus TaxID=45498 RepID=A0A3D8IWM9_9HELI|nr:hypothetical protein CQA62_04085 [Helicobacter cholecystus]